MGSYTLLKNQQLVAVLKDDFMDQGWVVSDGIAYHSGCNPGVIKREFDLSSATEWVFDFIVGPVTSGGVKIVVGGQSGATYTTPGKKQETFTVDDPDAEVLFYSDGVNSVEFLQVYPSTSLDNSRTIVFNEDENAWGGDHDYKPEYFHKFPTGLFVFKNGELWEQDVNPIHMNFFGVQYTAKVRFVANDNPQFNKFWLGMQIHSNGKWSVPSMTTLPDETYPNGMKSRLGETNFTLDQGKYWAEILRDQNDPQFTDQLTALFEGRNVEGYILVVEIENKSVAETILKSIYLYSANSERNF